MSQKEIKNKKQLIKNTAFEMFAEFGYKSSPISKIAKNAGVSKSLLYNYFKSKQCLLLEIMEEGMDMLFKIYNFNENTILSEKDIITLIDKTFDSLKNNITFWKLYVSIAIQKDVLELINAKIMEVTMPFLNSLTKYYENKGIKNPEIHALLLGSTFDGISLNYISQPELYPIDEIKKILIRKFV